MPEVVKELINTDSKDVKTQRINSEVDEKKFVEEAGAMKGFGKGKGNPRETPGKWQGKPTGASAARPPSSNIRSRLSSQRRRPR